MSERFKSKLLGERVLSRIRYERERQEGLRVAGRFEWTCADPKISNVEKLAVLLREVGEVAEAVRLSGDRREKLLALQTTEHLREELVQVAAVASAWAESLEPEIEETPHILRQDRQLSLFGAVEVEEHLKGPK